MNRVNKAVRIREFQFDCVHQIEQIVTAISPTLRIELLEFECVNLLEQIQCVYMLMHGGEIVYVGTTSNLIQRTLDHLSTRKKQHDVFHNFSSMPKTFDSVLFVRLPDELMNFTERTLTETFWPKHNGNRWTSNSCYPGINTSKHGKGTSRPLNKKYKWH